MVEHLTENPCITIKYYPAGGEENGHNKENGYNNGGGKDNQEFENADGGSRETT